MELISIVLALVSIGVALLIWYLQKQKARVRVEVQIETKPFNSEQERDVIYSNPSADKAVDVNVCVRSKHKTSISIQSSIIAVPKLLQLTTPSFLIRNWPVVDKIPLELRGHSLPATLPPGEELEDVYVPGLLVGQALDVEVIRVTRS
jgi:hypothetical protein